MRRPGNLGFFTESKDDLTCLPGCYKESIWMGGGMKSGFTAWQCSPKKKGVLYAAHLATPGYVARTASECMRGTTEEQYKKDSARAHAEATAAMEARVSAAGCLDLWREHQKAKPPTRKDAPLSPKESIEDFVKRTKPTTDRYRAWHRSESGRKFETCMRASETAIRKTKKGKKHLLIGAAILAAILLLRK